jgi:hypothetical protein
VSGRALRKWTYVMLILLLLGITSGWIGGL